MTVVTGSPVPQRRSSAQQTDRTMNPVTQGKEEGLNQPCRIRNQWYRRHQPIFHHFQTIAQAGRTWDILLKSYPPSQQKEKGRHEVDVKFTNRKLEELGSGRVREALDDYLKELKEGEVTTTARELHLLERVRKVCHLFQLTYVTTPSEYFTEAYLDWLNENFLAPGAELKEVLVAPHPPDHELFNPCLVKCAMRGHTQSVLGLISYLPEEDPVYSQFKELYRTMPRYTPSTRKEFPESWSTWKLNCLKAAEQVTEGVDVSLVTSKTIVVDLLKLMSGQSTTEPIMDLLCFYNDSWQEVLGSLLLFHFPTLALHNLEGILEWLLKVKYPESGREDPDFDNCCISLLTNDIVGVVRYGHQLDHWLGVHIVDLLEKRQLLERHVLFPSWDGKTLGEIREEYILEFVKDANLLEQEEMVDVGMTYLLECAKEGKQLLEKKLSQLEFQSFKARDRVLLLCKDYSLDKPYFDLCRKAYTHHSHKHQFTEAIKYLAQLTPTPQQTTTELGAYLLCLYLANCPFDFDDLQVTLSNFSFPQLDYLFQYRDFSELVKNQRHSAAADRALTLIRSPTTPSFLLAILLVDLVSLLTASPTLLDPPTLQLLINTHARLEFITTPHPPYQLATAILHATRTRTQLARSPTPEASTPLPPFPLPTAISADSGPAEDEDDPPFANLVIGALQAAYFTRMTQVHPA